MMISKVLILPLKKYYCYYPQFILNLSKIIEKLDNYGNNIIKN